MRFELFINIPESCDNVSLAYAINNQGLIARDALDRVQQNHTLLTGI